MKRLTERQRRVLDYIGEYAAANGYAPTLREVAGELGIRGAKNAGKHLDALERKGYIRRSPGVSRGIEITGGPGGRASGGVRVPIAGRVRAGGPELAVEDILGYVTLDEGFFGCTDAFMLRVEGESMTGAGIDDGDFVLVRPQSGCEPGDIVVALVDGEATVKRFLRGGDGAVILKAENPAFEPMVIEDGGAEVMIAGRVVSVIKNL